MFFWACYYWLSPRGNQLSAISNAFFLHGFFFFSTLICNVWTILRYLCVISLRSLFWYVVFLCVCMSCFSFVVCVDVLQVRKIKQVISCSFFLFSCFFSVILALLLYPEVLWIYHSQPILLPLPPPPQEKTLCRFSPDYICQYIFWFPFYFQCFSFTSKMMRQNLQKHLSWKVTSLMKFLS